MKTTLHLPKKSVIQYEQDVADYVDKLTLLHSHIRLKKHYAYCVESKDRLPDDWKMS